ncbi:MAG: hypothetical protein LBT58_04895 [Endomicrobium sp.]|jgi:hypothetical protein|nr:hypothetical protein [Endomicrobium sp.]
MVLNIAKPKISSKFSIDDIHKIREWNYKKLKKATIKERIKYYNSSVNILKAR